ncbi:uncharacterized protein MYCGRDRAFT_95050 [Zymoseptoria tritici IPO323]|uniref:Uncharacterized protein n=1 Tax=Zymoseptoria tritici (strain CBS 115943 / IPO323) TaxID=336722 RepID=F9XH59_ZYMTI|nr:uncharacterized protein MYCGRDRAFT_95050 [Zymoseptoria tritici IPO323]EGP84948.1 hypothetical protein MYCGRDRAFT_95050 [Zymoseptoria tritici IPO323]
MNFSTLITVVLVVLIAPITVRPSLSSNLSHSLMGGSHRRRATMTLLMVATAIATEIAWRSMDTVASEPFGVSRPTFSMRFTVLIAAVFVGLIAPALAVRSSFLGFIA